PARSRGSHSSGHAGRPWELHTQGDGPSHGTWRKVDRPARGSTCIDPMWIVTNPDPRSVVLHAARLLTGRMTDLAPARASRIPMTDTFHGVEVTEDYRWLEDAASE